MSYNLDTVLGHYWAAALWSTVDFLTPGLPENSDDCLDDRYDADDLHPDTLAAHREEVAAAIEAVGELADEHGWTAEQFGHDLWLTRERHGTGFWDRDLGTPKAREILTDYAQGMGNGSGYLALSDGALADA